MAIPNPPTNHCCNAGTGAEPKSAKAMAAIDTPSAAAARPQLCICRPKSRRCCKRRSTAAASSSWMTSGSTIQSSNHSTNSRRRFSSTSGSIRTFSAIAPRYGPQPMTLISATPPTAGRPGRGATHHVHRHPHHPCHRPAHRVEAPSAIRHRPAGGCQLAGDLGGTAAAPTVGAASASVAGKVELATGFETKALADGTHSVTSAGLATGTGIGIGRRLTRTSRSIPLGAAPFTWASAPTLAGLYHSGQASQLGSRPGHALPDL